MSPGGLNYITCLELPKELQLTGLNIVTLLAEDERAIGQCPHFDERPLSNYVVSKTNPKVHWWISVQQTFISTDRSR
ncbi:hypothetical protein J6590_004151 [Homalodisca vitripennis]|nr:hypothetical protein J6590_004151 [Homalodisca vitripennis]